MVVTRKDILKKPEYGKGRGKDERPGPRGFEDERQHRTRQANKIKISWFILEGRNMPRNALCLKIWRENAATIFTLLLNEDGYEAWRELPG